MNAWNITTNKKERVDEERSSESTLPFLVGRDPGLYGSAILYRWP